MEQSRKLCKQLTNFRIEINERAFFQLTKPLSNRIPFPPSRKLKVSKTHAANGCFRKLQKSDAKFPTAPLSRQKRTKRNEATNRVRRISFEGYIKKIRKFLERWKKKKKEKEVGCSGDTAVHGFILAKRQKCIFGVKGWVLQGMKRTK